jgi:hypothetical protein
MDAHLVFVVDLYMASAAHLGDIPPVRLRLRVLRAENQMASMAIDAKGSLHLSPFFDETPVDTILIGLYQIG